MAFNLKKFSQLEEIPQENESEISSEIEPNVENEAPVIGEIQQILTSGAENIAQVFQQMLEKIPPERISSIAEDTITQLYNSLKSGEL
jgi:actin-like ATPase involved in cell morphogenesis